MKPRTLALALVIVLPMSACARAQSQPATTQAVRPNVLEKGPYLQALTPTSVQIRWEGRDGTHGRVEWGAAPDRLDRAAVASIYPLTASYPEFLVTKGRDPRLPPPPIITVNVALQRVELTDLKPETTYHYRVRQGGVVTETYEFRTPPVNPRTFRLIIYGDTRTDTAGHRSVVQALRQVAPRPAFVVNTGDLVTLGDRWPLWSEEFFGPLHPFAAEVPISILRGNHEQGGQFLRPLFDLPGPEGTNYYRLDYGPARFIALDCYASVPRQAAWLEEQLRATPRPTWTFILLHEPPFSATTSRSYGRGYERERLMLLAQRYGVDFIFTGHDHVYARTVPILFDRTMRGEPTTQVITGSGGAPQHSLGHPTYLAAGARTRHFCVIDIDGPKFKMTVVNDAGKTIDEFRLEKGAKGKIIDPADYRERAQQVSDINAIESLRRSLTAFALKAVHVGDVVELASAVDNPYHGPVKVTVKFVGYATRWVLPPPVEMTIPDGAVAAPFKMTLTAKKDLADYSDGGRLEVEYVLPDGRKGALRGEGIRIAAEGE